jgi:hypothetical protein
VGDWVGPGVGPKKYNDFYHNKNHSYPLQITLFSRNLRGYLDSNKNQGKFSKSEKQEGLTLF